ncbi:MAG: phage baseplate assembly protein V [Acidobacteria bacterium]|nr:phage baseplate assembly protein V [Acidobacteriota bacterium]
MGLPPQAASHLVVTIDGKPHGKYSPDCILERVEVVQEINTHWTCMVELRQAPDHRFPIEDALGKDLLVEGFDEGGKSTVLFGGFVLRVKHKYEAYGSARVTIEGITNSYKLDVAKGCQFFASPSITDIANKLAADVGIKATVQEVKEKEIPLHYMLWHQTPFEFLQRLADDHGAWIRPDGDGIQINGVFDKPNTKLEWRKDGGGLISLEVCGELRPASMDGYFHEYNQKKSMSYTDVREEAQFFGSVQPMVDAVKAQSAEKLPPGYVGEAGRIKDFSDYENLLKKESVRSIGGALTVSGVSRNCAYYVGDQIEIDGSFDSGGTYGVLKIVNTWTRQGFLNKFWCTPWKDFTNREAPEPQKWHGVVSAHVGFNAVPERTGRTVINYPWNPNSPMPAVRTAQPSAGADRGFYFVHEMGDEVLVSFVDGNPERPVVVGALWNGVDKPPADDMWGGEFDNNDSKCIVTKSGNRIRINDKEGKEAIIIATPNKNRMTFMESSNENGRPSIMLHSDGDIFFSAGGRIHMKSADYSREVG